jgi:hypothetical protein
MIETLITNELHKAEQKFKPINSGHEGYAVIKEEIDELEKEYNDLNLTLNRLWIYVKKDHKEEQIKSTGLMYFATINIIKEAIQVAAMCKRFQKDLGVEEIK